jgi:hypothetical protein
MRTSGCSPTVQLFQFKPILLIYLEEIVDYFTAVYMLLSKVITESLFAIQSNYNLKTQFQMIFFKQFFLTTLKLVKYRTNKENNVQLE